MRELKFRQPIYDRKGKFYHFEYWGRLGPQDEYDEKCFKGPASASTMVSKPDEQFTGLHDKNGKEIYEGDIVLTQPFLTRPYSDSAKSKQFKAVVKYRLEQKTGCSEWYVCVIDEIGNYRYSSWGHFYDVEIIGNIHENPELLEEKE